MAVPKKKVSKARKHTRNSNNYKASTPTLAQCPKCHAMKEAHKVCPACGTYNGKQVIETEKKEKKAK